MQQEFPPGLILSENILRHTRCGLWLLRHFQSTKYTVRNNHHRTGKMAQQLTVYAALQRTHINPAHTGKLTTLYNSTPRGSDGFFWPPKVSTLRYTHTQNKCKTEQTWHYNPRTDCSAVWQYIPLQSNSLPPSTSDDYFISLSEWD